jgi:hypothetical protein
MGAAYTRALLRKIPNDKEGRVFADAIAEKHLAQMLKGDIRVTSEVTDRVDGKAPQSVKIGGDGDNPNPILFGNMTPEEKRIRLAHLLARQQQNGGKDGNRKRN